MFAYVCTCTRAKDMRKCYKGTLPSSRPPFLIGTRKGTPSPAFLFCCPDFVMTKTERKGR
nr:MAG TPA: hypothetical protein [Caudoviricetes sp.]